MPGYFLDTNVWIASHFEMHPHRSRARDFIAKCDPETPAWLARIVEHSFLRLLTTAAISRGYGAVSPTNSEALEVIADRRAQPHVRCLDAEPEGTRELWFELAAIPSASPKVWMDAYLAAFAIRAGLPFATLDSDFRRFEAAGLQLHFLSA